MLIYTNTAGTLTQIKEQTFKLEKEIQDLFETNIRWILLGLDIIMKCR